jgi:hypothetical protein
MSDGSMDNLTEDAPASPQPESSAIFFNGESSLRRPVTVTFSYALELRESLYSTVRWQYADIRRADSPVGVLRLTCLTGPALARLEIRDAALAAEVIARCRGWTKIGRAAEALPLSLDGRWRRRFRSSQWYCSEFRLRPIA